MFSILNQTVPVTRIIYATSTPEANTLPARLSKVLNHGLRGINLTDYDYLLRVDSDTTLPKDFLALNLKGKPDAVGWGSAHLIKTEPFIKYMNGRFNSEQDDSYVNFKFHQHGLKVYPYAVTPKVNRPVGVHHGYPYFINRGYIRYQIGYMPLRIFRNILHEKHKPFYLYGYFKALLTRAKLLDTANFLRNRQFKKRFNIKKILSSIKHYKKHPTWTRGPTTLQLGTNEICNLTCVYCNAEHYREGQIGKLSLKRAEKVIREVKDTIKKAHLFLNNEPLLEPRLDKFTALIKKYSKAKTGIYTNCTTYSKRFKLLDENLDVVHFTISAVSPETYLQVHGKPLFKEALRTYRWFLDHKRLNQQVYAHFVIVAENSHELPAWKQLFKDARQVVSPLHAGYKQHASADCLTRIDNKQAIKQSTKKGKMRADLPCTVWFNMAVSSNGLMLQCCDSPYSANYGSVDDSHVLDLWRTRNQNLMNNRACNECILKSREWKAILQKHVKSSV